MLESVADWGKENKDDDWLREGGDVRVIVRENRENLVKHTKYEDYCNGIRSVASYIRLSYPLAFMDSEVKKCEQAQDI